MLNVFKGIDVSSHQKEINWEKVKKSGVDFAIIRCGYGGNVKEQDDKYFMRNVSECLRFGIPFGVYLYSYADSVDDAKSEAEHTLRLLKGLKPEFPVYYDLEDAGTTGKCSNSVILQIAKTYVDLLEKAGYWVGIYASKYWFTNKLTDKWYDSKARWVAQYASKCTYKDTYQMWQYSSKGKVDGINGNVDVNECYVNYPALVKTAKKNGWGNTPATEHVTPLPSTPKYTKGKAVVFDEKAVYISSSAKKAFGKKTGRYYIYDGVKVNGRYRITNKAKNCGKKPAGLYVSFWAKL